MKPVESFSTTCRRRHTESLHSPQWYSLLMQLFFSFLLPLLLLTWRPFVRHTADSQNICFPSRGRSSRGGGGSARLTDVHLVLEMLTKLRGDFVTWLLRWDGCEIKDLFRFPTPANVSESNKGSFWCACVVILFMFDAKSFSDARETRFKRR